MHFLKFMICEIGETPWQFSLVYPACSTFCKCAAYPYFDSIKERIDVLDKEKLELRYTRYYEGGDLGKKLHSAVYAVKLVPLPDGGCVFKRTGEFNTIPGVELTEEDVQTLKAQDIAQFRALEGYLIDNPTAYA